MFNFNKKHYVVMINAAYVAEAMEAFNKVKVNDLNVENINVEAIDENGNDVVVEIFRARFVASEKEYNKLMGMVDNSMMKRM